MALCCISLHNWKQNIPSVFTRVLLNLLSLLQDFDRIVLNEALLGVARMFREELVAMPHDEDYNRSNTHPTTGYLDNRCYRELRSYLRHTE
jgi:hypothetical protein